MSSEGESDEDTKKKSKKVKGSSWSLPSASPCPGAQVEGGEGEEIQEGGEGGGLQTTAPAVLMFED